MGLWSDLKDGIRTIVLVEDRIEKLSIEQKTMAAQIIDHDRRLVRIETMIELSRGSAPRITPPER